MARPQTGGHENRSRTFPSLQRARHCLASLALAFALALAAAPAHAEVAGSRDRATSSSTYLQEALDGPAPRSIGRDGSRYRARESDIEFSVSTKKATIWHDAARAVHAPGHARLSRRDPSRRLRPKRRPPRVCDARPEPGWIDRGRIVLCTMQDPDSLPELAAWMADPDHPEARAVCASELATWPGAELLRGPIFARALRIQEGWLARSEIDPGRRRGDLPHGHAGAPGGVGAGPHHRPRAPSPRVRSVARSGMRGRRRDVARARARLLYAAGRGRGRMAAQQTTAPPSRHGRRNRRLRGRHHGRRHRTKPRVWPPDRGRCRRPSRCHGRHHLGRHGSQRVERDAAPVRSNASDLHSHRFRDLGGVAGGFSAHALAASPGARAPVVTALALAPVYFGFVMALDNAD